MPGMTIGGLAAAGGVGVETVRYYQRRGLLAAPPPAPGGRRYGEADARRLRFIRAGQAAGFTLDEVAELLLLDARDDRARARELAAGRIAALDARIAALTQARDALARLQTACGRGEAGPCPIIAAFEGEARRPSGLPHSRRAGRGARAPDAGGAMERRPPSGRRIRGLSP